MGKAFLRLTNPPLPLFIHRFQRLRTKKEQLTTIQCNVCMVWPGAEWLFQEQAEMSFDPKVRCQRQWFLCWEKVLSERLIYVDKWSPHMWFPWALCKHPKSTKIMKSRRVEEMEIAQCDRASRCSSSVEDEERKKKDCKMRMFSQELERRSSVVIPRATVTAIHPPWENTISCGLTATSPGHLRQSCFHSVLFPFSAFVYHCLLSFGTFHRAVFLYHQTFALLVLSSTSYFLTYLSRLDL